MFFFFREIAEEYTESKTKIFSRVAKVCKVSHSFCGVFLSSSNTFKSLFSSFVGFCNEMCYERTLFGLDQQDKIWAECLMLKTNITL